MPRSKQCTSLAQYAALHTAKTVHPRQSLCPMSETLRWGSGSVSTAAAWVTWWHQSPAKNWLSSRQYPSQETTDQHLLEAETPLQVLVLSAFLTFSNSFLLIRSCVAVAYQVLHDPEETVFCASMSFPFLSLKFLLLSRLGWNGRRNSERED